MMRSNTPSSVKRPVIAPFEIEVNVGGIVVAGVNFGI